MIVECVNLLLTCVTGAAIGATSILFFGTNAPGIDAVFVAIVRRAVLGFLIGMTIYIVNPWTMTFTSKYFSFTF